MRLDKIIARLDAFDEDSTIYAAQPWTPSSDAGVWPQPEKGGLPSQATMKGFQHFLEIAVAREIVDSMAGASVDDMIARVIKHAIDHA